MTIPALLALEDGSLFHGQAIGQVQGVALGEVVFNTSMTGYQEILSDPSYCSQLITLTSPHIGNVGVNEQDDEATRVVAKGLIVRDVPRCANNWRLQETLQTYLARHNIIGIEQIDTRRLTHLLRTKGTLKGCIMAGDIDVAAAISKAKACEGLAGKDLAQLVSTPHAYDAKALTWQLHHKGELEVPKTNFNVVAYDFGIKRAILNQLTCRGIAVHVVSGNHGCCECVSHAP